MTNKMGILLTNIGSPDQPTPAAVRSYLNQFLSDPRVVQIPRWLWWPILHGYILRTRPEKSAELYQQIWTETGSPLIYFSEHLTKKLEKQLHLPVALGMHYGNPTISSALETLRKQQVTKIILLPLYPQYSTTTTASSMDQVSSVLKTWSNPPTVTTIQQYADNENYINALCHSIKQHTIQHLLFSFHSIPKQYIDKGDPYQAQCLNTVRLVTEKLNLTPDMFSIAFQSRLGRAKWLTPYTDFMLRDLPKRGITHLHVICPGFSVDCLETLEEINIRGKKQFLQAGGSSFHYIPALNESDEHVSMLQKILQSVADS